MKYLEELLKKTFQNSPEIQILTSPKVTVKREKKFFKKFIKGQTKKFLSISNPTTPNYDLNLNNSINDINNQTTNFSFSFQYPDEKIQELDNNCSNMNINNNYYYEYINNSLIKFSFKIFYKYVKLFFINENNIKILNLNDKDNEIYFDFNENFKVKNELDDFLSNIIYRCINFDENDRNIIENILKNEIQINTHEKFYYEINNNNELSIIGNKIFIFKFINEYSNMWKKFNLKGL